MQLANSTVLITGASSGLGAATARRLHAAGANVVLADLNVAVGSKLATEIGSRARFVACDVTNSAQVQAAVDLAVGTFGSLQGLVCCAGILAGQRVIGKQGPHDLELFTRIVNINLVGTFNCVRLAAPAMANAPAGVDGERGVIVMTASISAYDGQIGQAGYAASKGGVASMTLPLARDLARHGIRIVSIAPGIMETPMVAALTDELRQSLESQIPFPSRLGKPDEYAQFVEQVFGNLLLNGSVHRLDGAVRMGPK
ncbi:MAG: SDR family NAD(P)-dependent oxidoreductase [Planctomycetaceae bacterium]|nr:SDR family NAD(P)-dependent oxidoreductase [Planctomycetaceae bacterium]